MHRLLRLVLASLLLLTATGAQARHRHRQAAGADQPGAFDEYLLSLSLAPSFCALSPANGARSECRQLTPALYHATPLTVHGLWPNRAFVSVRRQPQHCPAAGFAPLPGALQAGLDRYMPGGPGLERHEWERHGSCSGLSEADYFSTVLRLARAIDASLGAVIRDDHLFGQVVSVDRLRAALAERDPALAASLTVSCRVPRDHASGALIEEVRFTLSPSFAPIAASQVGCPGGQGLLPG